MKKNNIKLYIFIIMNILILFLNSFVYSILDKYNLIILLVVDIFIFYKLIGFEQHKFRYTKDIILDMFIFIMIFFLLYYILGLAIGFLRIENYFTIDGLKRYIFPAIIIVILKEILRYMVVIKLTKNNVLKLSVLILFLLFDVSTIIYYYNANNVITVFKLLALYIMPSISSNIMCMRLTSKVGYKPMSSV